MQPKVALRIAIAVVAIVVIAVLAWWSFARREEPLPERTAEDVADALQQTNAPSISVPTTRSPVSQVLPKETPLEKTNPFRDVSTNPFE